MTSKKIQPQGRKKSEKRITYSEEETILLAKDLAQGFKGTEVVLLEGELGAGKTVFVKGIAAGLGVTDVHLLSSPSFTLVNIYQAKYPIFHIDLYRLSKSTEISDLGWEDYLGQGVIIVEWAEKIPFPLRAIRVELQVENGEKRRIRIWLE